jgi:hypothetical protein
MRAMAQVTRKRGTGPRAVRPPFLSVFLSFISVAVLHYGFDRDIETLQIVL